MKIRKVSYSWIVFSRLHLVPEGNYFGLVTLAAKKKKKIENLLQEMKSKALADPTRCHLSLLTIHLAPRFADGEKEWLMP